MLFQITFTYQISDCIDILPTLYSSSPNVFEIKHESISEGQCDFRVNGTFNIVGIEREQQIGPSGSFVQWEEECTPMAFADETNIVIKNT